MKTAIEIVREKLIEMGADGLCTEDCGCQIADLFPCGESFANNCFAAKNNPEKAKEMEFDFWMEPMK